MPQITYISIVNSELATVNAALPPWCQLPGIPNPADATKTLIPEALSMAARDAYGLTGTVYNIITSQSRYTPPAPSASGEEPLLQFTSIDQSVTQSHPGIPIRYNTNPYIAAIPGASVQADRILLPAGRYDIMAQVYWRVISGSPSMFLMLFRAGTFTGVQVAGAFAASYGTTTARSLMNIAGPTHFMQVNAKIVGTGAVATEGKYCRFIIRKIG